MAKKILYLQPNENIAYLIHRLENAGDGEVYIAADAYPQLFEDAVSVRLLKREAEFLHKKITIVSRHQGVIAAAQNAEIDTLAADALELDESFRESAAQAERAAHGDATENAVAGAVVGEEEVTVRVMAADDRPNERVAVESAHSFEQPPLFAERKKNGNARPRMRSRFSWRIMVAGGVIIAGVAAAVGYYAFTPHLILTVTPKKESLSFEFRVVADTKLSAVDFENGKIPGQLISVKKDISDVFSASLRRSNDTKAGGSITIYNEYGSVPQPLVKSTRFKTSDGKIFRLTRAVTVPGATMVNNKVTAPGTVVASVEADAAGSAHNIGPSDFSIPGFEGTPKFLGFYGKSTESMTGGGAGSGFAASPEDLAKAKVALEEKFGTISDAYVRENIPQELRALSDIPMEKDIDFSAQEPDADGKFRATVTVTARVFAFAERDAIALGERMITRTANDAQPSPAVSRTVAYAQGVRGPEPSMFSFQATMHELMVRSVDGRALAESLTGKNEAEIKDVLRGNSAIESVELIFRPFWASAAPQNPERITVHINGG